MSVRVLFSSKDGSTHFLRLIDKVKASKHSKKICDDLAIQRTQPATVVLEGALGPTKLILNVIEKCNNGRLYIKVHDGSLERAIVILEAVYRLQIEPTQFHIENYVVGYISHKKLTPSEMITIHRAFGEVREASRVWKIMIHQTAWNVNNNFYTPREASELQEAAIKYDGLDEAVRAKIGELKHCRENYAEMKAEEETRQAARQARQEKKEQKAEERRLAREDREQRWWDEHHGMREASEATVAMVMRRAPPVVVWEEKK